MAQDQQKPGKSGNRQGNDTVDWGNSDGYSLWDSALDAENGFADWEGRQETHDLFHDSYD